MEKVKQYYKHIFITFYREKKILLGYQKLNIVQYSNKRMKKYLDRYWFLFFLTANSMVQADLKTKFDYSLQSTFDR